MDKKKSSIEPAKAQENDVTKVMPTVAIDIHDFYSLTNVNQEQLDALKKTRTRTWSFLVYPESAPEYWEQAMCAIGLPWARGPLHDKDVNPDGTPKKAHYHCILDYQSPTTFNNVSNIIRPITNGPYPINCCSVRGSYEYFTHKNNPEKYQYSSDAIKCFNSFDIENYKVQLTTKETQELMREIQRIIIEKKITELSELWALVMAMDDKYYDVVYNHDAMFNRFITSFRNNPRRVVKMYQSVLGVNVDVTDLIEEQQLLRYEKELTKLKAQEEIKKCKLSPRD